MSGGVKDGETQYSYGVCIYSDTTSITGYWLGANYEVMARPVACPYMGE